MDRFRLQVWYRWTSMTMEDDEANWVFVHTICLPVSVSGYR